MVDQEKMSEDFGLGPMEEAQNEPVQEENQEEPIADIEEAVEEETPSKKESEEKNFVRLREAKEKAEKERDELLSYLRKQQAEQNKPQNPIEEEEDDDDFNIAPDDLAEGKHLSKVAKKIKKLQKELKEYKQQSSQITTETRIKTQYPDFEKVVTHSNIEALREAYPELADSVNSTPDLYNKAVAAYTLIKKLGIHIEDTFEADRKIAQKNASKPRPLTSVAPQQGDSPLSRANAFANGLTPELRAQLHKEMESARKGY